MLAAIRNGFRAERARVILERVMFTSFYAAPERSGPTRLDVGKGAV
jgi:hypothetical protein